jgi:alpha-galactosidase
MTDTATVVDAHVRRGNPVAIPVESATSFYRHGWQSWSETRWIDPASLPTEVAVAERWPFADDPGYAGRGVHGGSALGAARDGDRVILLGALDLGGRVELRDGWLVGTFESGEGDWLVASGPEHDVFGRYALALGERFGRRQRHRSLTMWSSWYSYYDEISEGRIAAVLDEVAGLDLDIFQVDDGWQRAVGDWHANDRFPSGLDGLGDRIAERGYRPGLWIAPFIARDDSPLARDHPELFIHDDGGEPVFAGRNWGGPCHALDPTHPGTADVVADVVGRAVGAGFTCLKLDFLCAGALPGRRYSGASREEGYRLGVETIRRVAGDDVYLLACGAPIVASLGVFDGIRIGPDVAPWWELKDTTRYLHDVSVPNARYALTTSLHRLWLGEVIDTDPDVAYFRSRYCLLGDGERHALQDLARIAGFRATSDPPSWLDADELEEMARFLAVAPTVDHLGGHRYRVDGREVDFGPVATTAPAFHHWRRR